MRLPILKGTTGLNNRIDPARLKYNPETGIQELAVAYNIDLDDTGRPSRRKGFTQRLSGSYHSLFCGPGGGPCLVVTGTSLCIVSEAYTAEAIATVSAGARVDFCQVDETVFWLNSYEKGYVANGVNHSWAKPSSYIGTTTYRQLFDPPIGSFVEHYAGRIFIAQGNVVWYSDPFAYSQFDLARCFMREADEITMLRAVQDGLIVGTESSTWLYYGASPTSWEKLPLAPYPPIKYTDQNLYATLIFDQENTPLLDVAHGATKGAVWLSKHGVCFCGAQGSFANLTIRKLELPSGVSGASVVLEDGAFIGLINP